MFNTISWHSYWTMLAIILAIYYAIILFIYYRKDIIASFHSGALLKGERHPSLSTDEFQHPSNDSDEGVVYSCMDEINAFFEEAKKRKWDKSEMIYSLQGIIKKYPVIKTSGYKQSVTNVLRNQCEHVCNIHLDNEELNHVWLG